MVADVRGPAGEDLERLSKAFGAALALGRIKAQDDGDEKLAQLLDFAKVKPPAGRSFSLDVALPIEVLKDLGPCRKTPDDAPPAPAPERPAR